MYVYTKNMYIRCSSNLGPQSFEILWYSKMARDAPFNANARPALPDWPAMLDETGGWFLKILQLYHIH